MANDLDPDVSYKAKLVSNGYRTPNLAKQAMMAEEIEQACGLLKADATAIWKAAGGVSGRQLAVSFRLYECFSATHIQNLMHKAYTPEAAMSDATQENLHTPFHCLLHCFECTYCIA